MMIVEKQSALLGYPNEISQPLTANHQDICKFAHPDDPNYKSVRGALRSLVSVLREAKYSDGNSSEKDLETIGDWLNVNCPPEEDLVALRSIRKAGTCEDILGRTEFEELFLSQSPHILWVSAAPGSGKSVTCSFLIDYFKNQGARCCYWFFKHSDSQKRSLGNMLRALAHQMAVEDSGYRHALVGLAQSGIQVEKADAATVWRSIFAPKLHLFDREIFWVLDGLDESESSKIFFDLVSSIGSVPSSRIRVVIFSRSLPPIIQSVQRAKKRVTLTELALTDNLKDIRLFLDDEMEDFMADAEAKQQTVDQIAARSQGNFLWASLVTKRVIQCLRSEDVKRALQDIPDGMDKLYRRMAEAIAKLELEADRSLCRILLCWAMYASRPVAVEELAGPYAAELGTIMDLKHTVNHVCGQFVVINSSNHLSLVHHTARKYLRDSANFPFSLESSDANEDLLLTCLTAISDMSLRTKLRYRKIPPFLPYASVFWASHLDRSSVKSDAVLQHLSIFFDDDFPLTWIQFLAMSNKLSVLITVSSSLTSFVRRRRKADAIKPPAFRRLAELTLLESWAVDLLKMTAKFGSHLIQDPEAIHKCIPSLCPQTSMLYQKYAKRSVAAMSVSGLSTPYWDDCLARVSNGADQASHVAVSARFLAVAVESSNGEGAIMLWSSDIFQEHPGFSPGDRICSIAFSPSGRLLACCGLDHTYVWNVEDMSLEVRLGSPHGERALTLKFGPDESFLLVATDIRRIYRLDLNAEPPEWLGYPSPLLEERTTPEGAFLNSPSSVAFNPECTQVAVAYRGFPLSVWSLDPPEVLARCRRKQKQGQAMNTTWTGVNRIVWHPFDGHILGIYRDGNIFKWGTVDGSHGEVRQVLEATPSEIRCSNNGLVFATSDVHGSVKIYDYSQMILIYKLTSDDVVNAIAFGPDDRRFYDLRGSYCNVWEPNCLMREVNGGGSSPGDNESVMSLGSETRGSSLFPDSEDSRSMSMVSVAASEAHAGSTPAIVAVATCLRNDSLCAYAKDEGTVEIYDRARDAKHVIAQSTFGMAVGQVALSSTGDYIAYSTHDGRVTVKQVELSSGSGEGVNISLYWDEKKTTDRGDVSQLLFDTASKRLFVCGAEKLQVLKLDDGSVITERPLQGEEPLAKWESSPDNPDILLSFTPSSIGAFTWDELKLQHTFRIDDSAQRIPDPSSPTTSQAVEALLPSYHPGIHLLVTSFEESNNTYLTLLLLDTSVLRDHLSSLGVAQASTDESTSEIIPEDGGPAIRSLKIPADVAKRVEQPLGVLPDGRLVFFDENLWICTTQLGGFGLGSTTAESNSPTTRHFFIPRDWLNSTGLSLCRIQEDGTLLCPAKGDMAIIRSDVGTQW